MDGTKSVALVADHSPDSKTQVQRYIRLTELIPDLLEMVDEGRMALRPAVELSYLSQEEQEAVLSQIEEYDCTPSHAQAIRMRRLSENKILNVAAIKTIMKEEKPNQVEKIHVTYSKVKKYIPRSVPFNKTEDYIIKALEFYMNNRTNK